MYVPTLINHFEQCVNISAKVSGEESARSKTFSFRVKEVFFFFIRNIFSWRQWMHYYVRQTYIDKIVAKRKKKLMPAFESLWKLWCATYQICVWHLFVPGNQSTRWLVCRQVLEIFSYSFSVCSALAWEYWNCTLNHPTVICLCRIVSSVKMIFDHGHGSHISAINILLNWRSWQLSQVWKIKSINSIKSNLKAHNFHILPSDDVIDDGEFVKCADQ